MTPDIRATIARARELLAAKARGGPFSPRRALVNEVPRLLPAILDALEEARKDARALRQILADGLRQQDETRDDGYCLWCQMEDREDGYYHADDCNAANALKGEAKP